MDSDKISAAGISKSMDDGIFHDWLKNKLRNVNRLIVYLCFQEQLYFFAVAEIDHIQINRSMFDS